MGLKGTAGDVVRWSSRVKLARNFRALQVEDCSEQTLAGYSALFQVFLTHSALELYRSVVNLTKEDDLEPHTCRKIVPGLPIDRNTSRTALWFFVANLSTPDNI